MLRKLFITALTVWAFNAQADLKSADIRIGQTVSLTNCKGTATLDRNYYGELILYVRGTQCSNLRTNLSATKLDGYEQNRYVDVLILEQGQGSVPVIIGGNSFVESNGYRGVGDKLNVILPANVKTIPSNWNYQYVEVYDYLWGYVNVCYLVDSSRTAILEMTDSKCNSGTRALPEGAFYSEMNGGGDACYLWLDNSTRASANAVKKEKCN
jgi:hypothetical protein